MKPYLITSVFLFFFLAIAVKGGASTVVTETTAANDSTQWKPKVLITKHYAYEENPLFYYHNISIFRDLQTNVNSYEAKGIYWLRINIKPEQHVKQKKYVLSFNNLTYVDLTLIDDLTGKIIENRKSGLFRPGEYITPDDNRNCFVLEMDGGRTYTCMLRVQHIKGYRPQLDFYIEEQLIFLKRQQYSTNLYAFMEGAIIIMLLYIALSWIVSRYRAYIWIFTFLLSLGIYSFTLQTQFLDFFFPSNPELGWAITPFFYRMGTIGFYILLIDFLNLKTLSPIFYKLGITICCLVISFALFSFIYSYSTSNYYLANRFNFVLGALHIGYLSTMFVSLWKKIDNTQRFLAYGTIFFSIGVSIIIALLIQMEEKSLLYIPALVQFFVLSITIIFLICIRLKIKKIEDEYNKSIELRVQERTRELKNANKVLNFQQIELVQKNTYIETLIDELNHRVKNNLQLLYSLGSLYRKDEKNSLKNNPAIQEMQSRIHIMMLVNQLLVYNKGDKVRLDQLVEQSTNYLQQLYDPQKKIAIQLDIYLDCWLSTKVSIPLGLIITELLTNSYKYAFPNGNMGNQTIRLVIHKEAEKITMDFSDNGVGSDKIVEKSSLGITLIKDLTRQIKGQITINHQDGYHYQFEFKSSTWA